MVSRMRPLADGPRGCALGGDGILPPMGVVGERCPFVLFMGL